MSGPSNYVLANMTKGFRLDTSSSSSSSRHQHESTTTSNSNSSNGSGTMDKTTSSSNVPSSSSSFRTQVYQDIASELVDRGRGKRIKDWKAHLSLLRELTVFLTPRDILSIDVCEALNATLLQLQESQLSSDVGKKLFRITCHILFDNIVKIASMNGTIKNRDNDGHDKNGGHINNEYSHGLNENTLDLSITSKEVQGVVIELFKKVFNAVEKVDDNSTTSTKMFFCWRLLGSFVGYQTVPSELSDKLIEQVSTHLKALTFPEKKKATLLSGLGMYIQIDATESVTLSYMT